MPCDTCTTIDKCNALEGDQEMYQISICLAKGTPTYTEGREERMQLFVNTMEEEMEEEEGCYDSAEMDGLSEPS